MNKNLGILILSKLESRDMEILLGVCRAGIEKGVPVELFFMGDGVYSLAHPRLSDLMDQGVRMSFCVLNATERHLDKRPQYPWGVQEGSQFNLACLVENAERFLVFA